MRAFLRLRLRLGRLSLRLHVLVPALAAGLVLWRPVPGARYLLLLASLALHELAHAAAALVLGRGPAVVSLWPVFGRADVEPFPDRREAAVALAAPAANLVAAALAALAGGRPVLAGLAAAPVADFVVTANLVMGLGNLFPLPPADGGRALRALRRRAGSPVGRGGLS